MSDKIVCKICGEGVNFIPGHLKKAHPSTTKEQYQEDFPGAPMMSAQFKKEYERRKREKNAAKQSSKLQQIASNVVPFVSTNLVEKRPFHETFDLPLNSETARLGDPEKGGPIMIDVLANLPPELEEMVPEIDDSYVFDPIILKHGIMALQLNMPFYAWGAHGTGKTTFIEQICARTNRPLVRTQHTETTEEAHIIGQMVVRNQATEFDEGPLPDAMRRGIVYLADEYDVAHAGVHAVYQPVMEGKNLFIKEAPPGQRLIKPHELFRFVATGNTNGSGDETGLYAGTKIGNAANYSRFGITVKVPYPNPETETAMLVNRVGVSKKDAAALVDIATRIREQYDNGEISIPISPRELLSATTLGVMNSGKWNIGFQLAYTNRLGKTEAEAVQQVVQRVI